MQFFTGKNSWPPHRSAASEKRKHDSVESPLDEEGRKKRKAENGVIRDGTNRRGSAGSLHSPSSIDARQSPITQTSPPSPPTHPDRLQRFPPGSSSQNSTSKIYPTDPLSKSPEHCVEELAADHSQSSTTYYPNLVWKAESWQSSDGSSRPKPLQIDTARAISDLDPRSPGYAIRKMPSEGKGDKISSHKQGSHDADWSSSNPQSRRQSETMLPPPSASTRLPRSESSTPKTSTPVVTKEPMNPASATLYLSGRKNSTSTDFSISADAKEFALPKIAAPRIQASPPRNFMGFAQSIMSTTSVNIKLENMKGLAIENVKESRRHEKHNVAYASLVDLTSAHHGAIQKAKMKLEKQFERCITNQDSIANALEVRTSQPSVAPYMDGAMDTGTEISKEFADLREDLRKLRIGLADQRDKGIRQKDLDRFARKIASLEDLEQLITKEELLDVRDKLSARTSDLKRLEAKVSDLADVAKERHCKAQDTQERCDQHLKDLDAEMSAARNSGQQRYTNTQTKLAELKLDLGALKEASGVQTKLAEVLKKSVDSWKEDSASLKEEFKQLQSAQAGLKALVQGDPSNSEAGLSKLIENASGQCLQWKTLVEQLQEKIGKLEEGAAKDSASPHQQQTPEEASKERSQLKALMEQLQGKIERLEEVARKDTTSPYHQQMPIVNTVELVRQLDTLRHDFTDLREEHDLVAGDMEEIRTQQQKQLEEFYRFKERVEKQQPHSGPAATLHPGATAPPHPDGTVSHENQDHIKLEKLEHDLQALDVVMKTQQMRFDNLTTEDMARSIIHQTKQLYKEHPGHVQDKLRILEEQQRNVDAYITGNLQPRLLQVDMQISLRATTDALKALNNRVQALEVSMKEAISQIVQARKDLSESITNARRTSIPRNQGPVGARLQENISTLHEELKEVRSKHAELVEMVMRRHGKLRGDVQILNREIYTEAAGNSQKQAKLRGSLEYMDLIKTDLNDVEATRQSESIELNEGIHFRASVASMSSSRQESVASGVNERQSVSNDEPDTPMSQPQDRKRKRQSLPKISDDKDDDANNARRRAAGKGPG